MPISKRFLEDVEEHKRFPRQRNKWMIHGDSDTHSNKQIAQSSGPLEPLGPGTPTAREHDGGQIWCSYRSYPSSTRHKTKQRRPVVTPCYTPQTNMDPEKKKRIHPRSVDEACCPWRTTTSLEFGPASGVSGWARRPYQFGPLEEAK